MPFKEGCMRKLTIGSVLTLLAFAAMPVYAKRSQDVKVQINKSVTSGSLKIEFVELVEDSRCPADAQCIWAGNAKIKVRVSFRDGRARDYELNTSTSPQSVKVGRYDIRLTGLTQPPTDNETDQKNGYIATFSLTKSAD